MVLRHDSLNDPLSQYYFTRFQQIKTKCRDDKNIQIFYYGFNKEVYACMGVGGGRKSLAPPPKHSRGPYRNLPPARSKLFVRIYTYVVQLTKISAL